MEIYDEEIRAEVVKLTESIEFYGNSALSHEEKMALSDQLAYVSHLVRQKYELTSAYYMQSESGSAKKVHDIIFAKTPKEHAAAKLTDLTGSSGAWVINTSNELVCGSCGHRALRKVSLIQEHSNFCPFCGRRMKKL